MVPNLIETGLLRVRFCSDGRVLMWDTNASDYDEPMWLSRDNATVLRARLAMTPEGEWNKYHRDILNNGPEQILLHGVAKRKRRAT